MPTNRDISLDLMKAIGILAIIIGHYGIGIQFVFSFHVPLFFVIGGYLFKQKTFKDELRIDARRLLVPYLLTSLFILAWDSAIAIKNGVFAPIKERIVEIFATGGGCSQEYILLGTIGQIGAIWFLLALMVCRMIYNALDRALSGNTLSIVCLILSISAIAIHKYVGALSWNFLQGTSALVFYDAGRRIKQRGGWKSIHEWIGGVGVLLWGVAIAYSHTSMVSCTFNCYPIDVIGALGATWIIALLCMGLSQKSHKWLKGLAWIGRNSLGLLCLHLIDLETGILHKLQHWTVDWHYHNAYLHIIIVVTASCALIYGWDLLKQKTNKITECKNS